MSMEPWTPSLHAGLIERARPLPSAKVVPLREAEFYARAPAAPLRESAIARARRLLGRASDASEAPAPWVLPTEQRDAPEEARRRSLWSFRQRFGLTVRVHSGLRELLFRARLRTGRTTQSILHDALVHYLDRLEPQHGQSERSSGRAGR